jgi:glycerol-3-phosphate dehydrogenase
MKIAIAGTGYVGLSIAVLLAQRHEVVALDIVPAKVDQINARHSPIEDAEIERALASQPLNLRATLSREEAYAGARPLGCPAGAVRPSAGSVSADAATGRRQAGCGETGTHSDHSDADAG